MTVRRSLIGVVAVALALAAAGLSGIAARASQGTSWSVTTVTTGLDSPRGLAFAPRGDLYVAEAGHGGDVCVTEGTAKHCIGTSSQITKVDPGTGALTPVVTGLFSSSEPKPGITGVDGLAASGGRLLAILSESRQAFADWSCSGQPADCPQVLAAAQAEAGRLIQVTPGGTWRPVADVGGQDYAYTVQNPGQVDPTAGVDANPFGVLAVPDGAWVAGQPWFCRRP